MDTLILSKLLTALAYPAGLIPLLMLLYFVFNAAKRSVLAGLCRVACVVVFLLSTNPMFASWLTSTLEQQYPQQPLSSIAKHDAIIVLGGGLRIPLPPAQHTQLSAASDRYWYATQLYRAGKASTIILSGGNLYPQLNYAGEAQYAQQLLLAWGVPSEAILYEANSKTTQQNKEYTATLLAKHNINSALLVTSASHMPRAYDIFRALSVELTPASADVIVRAANRPQIFNWLPSANAFQQTTLALHEHYGMAARYVSKRLNAFIDSA